MTGGGEGIQYKHLNARWEPANRRIQHDVRHVRNVSFEVPA